MLEGVRTIAHRDQGRDKHVMYGGNHDTNVYLDTT